MSVVITLKFQGDVATFRQAIVEHADDFTKMAEEARGSGGGIHHRFAVGDGFVLVLDERESVEHFQKFFANPDLASHHRGVRRRPAAAGDHHRRGDLHPRRVLKVTTSLRVGASSAGSQLVV